MANPPISKILDDIATLNIKHLIQKMNRKNVMDTPNTRYQLLRCTTNSTNKKFQYYLIDKNDLIGKGAFGETYKTYLINSETGTLATSAKGEIQEFVVKIIFDKTTFNAKEADELSKRFKTEAPVQDGNKIFLVNEYLPGNDLDQVSKQIKSLNFQERIRIIREISLNINQTHHTTPSTGNAAVHADVKHANIRILFNTSNKNPNDSPRFDTHLIDFGLAMDIENNSDKVKSAREKGTLYYMAPETITGEYGAKTDIYALTPVFASILGARNPFAKKEQQHQQEIGKHADSDTSEIPMANVYLAPYDFNGIFNSYAESIPEHEIPIKKNVLSFLQRMQDPIYDHRPDSDEALFFFNNIDQLCQKYKELQEIENQDADLPASLYTEGARLALLSAGLWNEKIGRDLISEPVPETNHNSTHSVIINQLTNSSIQHPKFTPNLSKAKTILGIETIQLVKTLKNYDFEINPLVSKAIVLLNNESLLTASIVKALCATTQTDVGFLATESAKALALKIIDLQSNHSLNETTINTLHTPTSTSKKTPPQPSPIIQDKKSNSTATKYKTNPITPNIEKKKNPSGVSRFFTQFVTQKNKGTVYLEEEPKPTKNNFFKKK